jgi:hypothetical protein
MSCTARLLSRPRQRAVARFGNLRLTRLGFSSGSQARIACSGAARRKPPEPRRSMLS